MMATVAFMSPKNLFRILFFHRLVTASGLGWVYFFSMQNLGANQKMHKRSKCSYLSKHMWVVHKYATIAYKPLP